MKHVVAHILPTGITIFEAPPLCGKSWLCLQLAESVSNGIPFLGRETVRGKVLYLDPSGWGFRTQKRLEKASITKTKDFMFCYMCLPLGGGFHQQMKTCVKNNPGIKLIIVDDLDRIVDKAAQTQEMILNIFREWAIQEGIAVVFVTDMIGKARYAKVRTIDALWIINKHRKQNTLTIRGHHAESSEIQIHFDKNVCRWLL